MIVTRLVLAVPSSPLRHQPGPVRPSAGRHPSNWFPTRQSFFAFSPSRCRHGLASRTDLVEARRRSGSSCSNGWRGSSRRQQSSSTASWRPGTIRTMRKCRIGSSGQGGAEATASRCDTGPGLNTCCFSGASGGRLSPDCWRRTGLPAARRTSNW